MKKGTFRKVLGITAVLVVLGVITMIALSPRGKGFCPDLFTLGRGAAAQPQPESVPVQIPEAVSDSLPPIEESVSDTLTVE